MKSIKSVLIISFLTFIVLNSAGFAQSEFQIEFYKSRGTLKQSDLFRKELGRYKGFEIPANKGEAGSFVVYSPRFKPSLFLADEKGNLIKQVSGRDEHTAILSSSFPSSGNYILFLAADSASRGEYEFQYAFASENSLTLKPESDFKTAISYLTEHAKAYFLFFENPVDGKNSFYKIEGASDVNIETDGSYRAVFYKGEDLNTAQNIYASLSTKLFGCFDNGWKKENSDWKQNKNVKEKYLLHKEKTDEESRSVRLSLFDFSKAKDTYRYTYGVTLIISKDH